MDTVQEFMPDYESLQQTVAALDRRVTFLESRAESDDRDQGWPLPTEIDRFKEAIEHITRELFPGENAITLSVDPEYPTEPIHVVQVRASGEVEEIEARRTAWHQRIGQLSPNLALLALSIDYGDHEGQ